MTPKTPWIAAILAVVGLVLVLLSAVMGVTPASDDVLTAAQLSLLAAALIFGLYILVGLIKDFVRS